MLASRTTEHEVTSAAVQFGVLLAAVIAQLITGTAQGFCVSAVIPNQLACMQFTELQSSLQRGFDSMSVCNRISQQALPEGLTMLSTGFLQIWLVS